ncbi:MAG: right-handed parallel beta-helix repeat-containing protein, partial [Caldilineaceae bacterium]
IEMHWIGNTFADNIKYGFDPHDFSDRFLFEENVAYGNGSHGIIFSRGCNYNIIRNNKSYNNAGHGIMIDDGKVVPDGDNVRHLAAVPSNYNLIENNIVTNNDDGIVLEGGAHNVVRNNTIIGPHRYGIRLKDDVTQTLVVSNTIEQSERFAIFVYNNSANNHFEHNRIIGAAGGLLLQDAPATTFRANEVKNIAGAAIALEGNVAGSVITGNRFSGSGRQPLHMATDGLTTQQIQDANDFRQWRHPTPNFIPTLVIGAWALIFFVPIIMWIRRNLRNRRMQADQII